MPGRQRWLGAAAAAAGGPRQVCAHTLVAALAAQLYRSCGALGWTTNLLRAAVSGGCCLGQCCQTAQRCELQVPDPLASIHAGCIK